MQADADHEVVTTPLFKLYQTNWVRRERDLLRVVDLIRERFRMRPSDQGPVDPLSTETSHRSVMNAEQLD